MLTTPKFDINRAVIRENSLTPPLTNPKLIPISEAQQVYEFSSETPMFLTEVGDHHLAFTTMHLAYHHVAQGLIEDMPWMVSFCLICNAGFCFSPIIDGQVHEFAEIGYYNAMTILADKETNSIWHHITGECMHGDLIGQSLQRLNVLQHATFQHILENYPDALFAVATLDAEASETAQQWEDYRHQTDAQLPESWAVTMAPQNLRLPNMEAGLGIWDGNTARFYPYRILHAHNNVIFDNFGERQLVIFEDAEADFPTAFYTGATSAELRGDTILLNNGEKIRNFILYGADDKPKMSERPLQLFQRYYSFAFLFPDSDIFDQ